MGNWEVYLLPKLIGIMISLTDGALVLQVECSPGGRPEGGRGGPPGLLGELAGLEVGVVGGGPADIVGGLDAKLPASRDVLDVLSLLKNKVTDPNIESKAPLTSSLAIPTNSY